MVLQAGGVRRLLGADPAREREREALAGIEETGRQAVGELHRMLGILRKSRARARAVAVAAPRRRAGRAGPRRRPRRALRRARASPPTSRPGVDMSAYRIVQEALTNALRYAPGSTVGVTVAYGRDCSSRSATTARARNGHADARLRPRHRRHARARRAVRWRAGGRVRRPAAASVRPRASAARSPLLDDPCRRGRRSGARARRAEDGARGRGRHRGRRRGRRRRAGARGRAPHAARRRADGHPHAGARRPRGLAAAAGRATTRRRCSC